VYSITPHFSFFCNLITNATVRNIHVMQVQYTATAKVMLASKVHLQ